MKPINVKRVLLGGLCAGIVVIIITFLTDTFVLLNKYEYFIGLGRIRKNPALPYLPISILVNLGLGLGFAWLYAAVRTQLTPGPKTAIILGFVLGLMLGLPENFGAACWATIGKMIPFVHFVTTLIYSVLGTLIAGYLYQESPASPPSS